MLRVKIPQGVLASAQLRALAAVGDRYSRGFGHITTRQNLQFHFIKLHDVEPAMRELAAAGLTTREACGNSVRNITGCHYAGVAADELFDVTPYAEALTRYLLRHPLSSSLPRKFKIAFEGCLEDHALTAINDLGFRARVRGVNGGRERGFRVTAGGGTSILCASGRLLDEFLPAGELFNLAEAVVRVFHRLGDREHKQRNRMKFLIKNLGWDRWEQEVIAALAEFRATGGARLPFDAQNPPVEEAPPAPRQPLPSAPQLAQRAGGAQVRGPGIIPSLEGNLRPTELELRQWLRTNVRRQKQPGYVVATATVSLGDLTSEQFRIIADLAEALGDGTVRVSPEQNLLFRWIPTEASADLYRSLAAVGLGSSHASTIADVTSCPGAESCRLAVTQSRGLARLLEQHLRSRPELINAAEDLKIKISGCPNGCGQHHIAGIGFQGSIRRLGSKVLPQYFVLLGGAVGENGARFGRLAAKIPARRLPQAVDRLIDLYVADRANGESATDFFGRVGIDRAKVALAGLEHLELAEAVPDDYIDLGEELEFRPEVQEGECAA
jgi:sulfite reductase (NADPH) hemoprotein beta-component